MGYQEHTSSFPDHRNDTLYNWQAGRRTLVERATYLLDDQDTLCDVVAVIGKGVAQQEVPCHRFLLAMGSPVFQTMFYGPRRQLAEGADLHLPDIEPAAFRNLLRYVYTDDVSSLADDNVIATLAVAKRFEVETLRVECLEFMKEAIKPDNVFVILEQARQNGEVELVHRCLDLIDQRTLAVVSSTAFLEIDIDTLAMLLSRDELSVREIELFHAVERWAVEECARQELPDDSVSRRKVSEELIKHIRFPLMSVDELANGPVQSGMLTTEETTELFLYLFATLKPPMRFRTSPRQGSCGEEYSVMRFTETGGAWGYAGGPDSIQFTVDRDIVLVGCGLYGAEEGAAEHSVALTVVQNGETLLQEDALLQSDGETRVVRVMFLDPVPVRAGLDYVVAAKIQGGSTFSGQSGSAKVTAVISGNNHSDCVFTFSDARQSVNGTNVASGQIPTLIFCLPS